MKPRDTRLLQCTRRNGRKNSLEERSRFVMVKRPILPDVFLRKAGASRFFTRILYFVIASASVTKYLHEFCN